MSSPDCPVCFSPLARGMPVALLALALVFGCGTGDEVGPPVADGGLGTIDASMPGSGADEGGVARDADRDGLAADPALEGDDPDGRFEGTGGAGACYDGEDNDGDGDSDCSASGCRHLRSCCVGSGACCSPVTEAALPPMVDFADCAAEEEPEAVSCLQAADTDGYVFGSPSPWVDGDGLYPGGDDEFDSGLVVGEPVSLDSHRLELTVRFGVPRDCGSGCRDSAAVALSTEPPPEDRIEAHVRPAVALVLRGARQQLALLVSGEVVRTWPLPDGADSVTWTLQLQPDGELRVLRGEEREETFGATHTLPSRARLVLYGRSRNRAEELTGARIHQLEAQIGLCDIPTRWQVRQPLRLLERGTGGGEVDPAPSVPNASLGYDGRGWATVAFEHRDGSDRPAVRLAKRHVDSTERDEVSLVRSLDEPPALSGEHDYDAGGVTDPELLWNEHAGQWVMLFTAIDADGKRSIGRATASQEDIQLTADGEPVLTPAGKVTDYAEPTVARRSDGTWVMVVRARLDSGAWRARIFRSSDESGGTDWEPLPSGGLDKALHDTQQRGAPGFDAREVRQPSLVIHNGAWQLYYARRSGSRWSIGLVVSDELLHWRHAHDGFAVMEAGDAAFEALGVAAPDIYSHARASADPHDELELLYIGLDGVQARLARAVRRAADDGRF